MFCLFFKILKRFYLLGNIELWMFWILCLVTEMVFTFMLVHKWCTIWDFGCLFQSCVMCWILLGSLKRWVETYFFASRNFFLVKGLVQVRSRSVYVEHDSSSSVKTKLEEASFNLGFLCWYLFWSIIIEIFWSIIRDILIKPNFFGTLPPKATKGDKLIT